MFLLCCPDNRTLRVMVLHTVAQCGRLVWGKGLLVFNFDYGALTSHIRLLGL